MVGRIISLILLLFVCSTPGESSLVYRQRFAIELLIPLNLNYDEGV